MKVTGFVVIVSNPFLSRLNYIDLTLHNPVAPSRDVTNFNRADLQQTGVKAKAYTLDLAEIETVQEKISAIATNEIVICHTLYAN